MKCENFQALKEFKPSILFTLIDVVSRVVQWVGHIMLGFKETLFLAA